jgi:hypothetical protein
MKIKNLYVKVISKVVLPTDTNVETSVDNYIKNQVKQDPNFIFDKEDLLKEAKEQLTKVSTQLRKINKIQPLDAFIRSNINNIDEMGKSLLLKSSDFNDLCKKCGFPEDIKFIEIFLDANTVFCRVLNVNKAELSLALAEKKISVKKYDELMQLVDE